MDLERAACAAWIRTAAPDVAVHQAALIRPIEEAPEVPAELVKLGAAIEAPASASRAAVTAALLTDNGDALRQILAQLGIARMLRILTWIDQAEPRLISVTLQDEQSEAGQCIRATLDALNRQELLGRMFSPERLQRLLAVTDHAAREAA